METMGYMRPHSILRAVTLPACIALTLACGLLYGQIIVSSIVGRVLDASGAAVPGAQITVTNTQTGSAVKATTTAQGTYSVPGLLAGTYDVTIGKRGFQTQENKGITLLSAETARVDAALHLGSTRQSVSIVGRAPLIHTDSMTIGGSVTTTQLADLPTTLQTVDAFLALAPGVQAYNGAGSQASTSTNPPIGGGTHWGSVNFTLNGVEVNDPGNSGGATVQGTGGGLLVLPPPSALQELSVQSNGMTAAYRGKSTVTLVTKNGTNRFHGQLYEYLQNTDLNANSFILNAAADPRPPVQLNQYGGNIGGPIKRDKAFFFFDYSGYRHNYANPEQLNLPSAAMRSGDFSVLCKTFNASGICSSGTQLYDPATGQAFAGNQIPTTAIASQSTALLSYLPSLTLANSPGLPSELPNYVSTVSAVARLGAWDLRTDYNLTPKDRIFGVYAQRISDPWGSTNSSYPAEYGQNVYGYKERNLTLSETHTFGPGTLNELRAAWGEYATKFGGENLGFAGNSLWPQMPASLFHGLPTITASGYTGLWHDYGTGLYTPRKDVEIADDFTQIHGRHTIQAGMDETGYKVWNRIPAASNVTGAFGFNGKWTGNNGWPALPHSAGNAFADFLLGDASTSQTPATGGYAAYMYSHYWGFYAQDTWQATPRLTFIYGLRYEYQNPWHYRTQQITSIDLVNDKLVLPENSATPTLPPGALAGEFAAYPFETTQSIGQPLHFYRGDMNNFAPRVGLAYRPFNDPRTVIRAGYGVYYNFQPALVGSGRDAFNPPWELAVTQAFASKLPGKPAAPFLPDITFASPFPGVNSSSVVTPNPTLNFFEWDFRNAVDQEWNLTIEHQFSSNWAVRASYVGSQTHHIPYNSDNINVPVTQVPNETIQAQSPYQPWGAINSYRSAGKQNFNRLEFGVNKRFASGMGFQAEYQFTRSLDNIPQSGGPQNWHFGNLAYGNSTGLATHWLVFNYVYALPFGHGQFFLRNASRWTNALVGGWQVSGISTYGTGEPQNMAFSQTGTGVVGWAGTYPDVVPGGAAYISHSGHNITQGVPYINPAAFTPPAKWTYGNFDRDSVFGPGLWNWDISASKTFVLRESLRLQVRSDFLDAFNHFNLGNPNLTIADSRDHGTAEPTAGMITSGSGSRIVQLGAELIF